MRIGEVVNRLRAFDVQVHDDVVVLRHEVSDVNTILSSVDRRMGTLESNTLRTAQGVELLVRLVSSSHVLDNADAESVRQLHAFSVNAELPAPMLQPRIQGPPEYHRSNSVMRALLMPSTVASH